MEPIEPDKVRHKRAAFAVIGVGIALIVLPFVYNFFALNQIYGLAGNINDGCKPNSSCDKTLHHYMVTTTITKYATYAGFAVTAGGGVYLAYAENRLNLRRS